MMIAKKRLHLHQKSNLKWLNQMMMKNLQTILTIARLISKLCWRVNKNNLKNKRPPKHQNQAKLQFPHQNKKKFKKTMTNPIKRKERETRRTRSEILAKFILLCLIKTKINSLNVILFRHFSTYFLVFLSLGPVFYILFKKEKKVYFS